MRARIVIVGAAVFAVAPLSAHQRPNDASMTGDEVGCPYERAAAEAAGTDQTIVTIETAAPEGSLFGGRRQAAALLP